MQVLRHTYFHGRSCRPPYTRSRPCSHHRHTCPRRLCHKSNSVSHMLKWHRRYMVVSFMRVTPMKSKAEFSCYHLLTHVCIKRTETTNDLRAQTPAVFMLVYPDSQLPALHEPLPAVSQSSQCSLQAETHYNKIKSGRMRTTCLLTVCPSGTTNKYHFEGGGSSIEQV